MCAEITQHTSCDPASPWIMRCSKQVPLLRGELSTHLVHILSRRYLKTHRNWQARALSFFTSFGLAMGLGPKGQAQMAKPFGPGPRPGSFWPGPLGPKGWAQRARPKGPGPKGACQIGCFIWSSALRGGGVSQLCFENRATGSCVGCTGSSCGPVLPSS